MGLTREDWDATLANLDLRICIPSRGRYKTCTTPHMMPFVELWVPEEEQQLYADHCPNPIKCYADTVSSGIEAANFIRDNHPDKPQRFFFFDDDVMRFITTDKESLITAAPEDVLHHVFVLTAMAADLGCPLYGLGLGRSLLYGNASIPFMLNKYVSACACGFNNGAHIRTTMKLKGDVDMSLQALMEDRIILSSNMYSAFWGCDNNPGGDMNMKTRNAILYWANEIENKWGKLYVAFEKNKNSNVSMNVKVTRKSLMCPSEYK